MVYGLKDTAYDDRPGTQLATWSGTRVVACYPVTADLVVSLLIRTDPMAERLSLESAIDIVWLTGA